MHMRRIMDCIVALLVLLIASPLLIVVALAIVIDSPGNPFYRAIRAGQHGRLFRMWKFRTMVPRAAQLGPAITGGRDPRVTRMGALLRRTKIDELPQFFNVLLGDMSLVGPRPESPEIVAKYTPEQARVLAAKPGVTGQVQLTSGEESDSIPQGVDAEEYYIRHLMDGKVRRDIEYLNTRTAGSDARIVFSTAFYVMRALAAPLRSLGRKEA